MKERLIRPYQQDGLKSLAHRDILAHRWRIRQTMFLDTWLRWIREEMARAKRDREWKGWMVCEMTFKTEHITSTQGQHGPVEMRLYWGEQDIINGDQCHVPGNKAYVMYGDCQLVKAVVFAHDYDHALDIAADSGALMEYEIATERDLMDYADYDEHGKVSGYPSVHSIGTKATHGYDLDGLNYIEIEAKELIEKE